MKKKFNKKEYDINYHKEKLSKFVVDLKKEEFIELNMLLKQLGLSKAEFLRKSIKKLKEELGMLTSRDLLVEVMKLGFDREYALAGIDSALDETFGFENRKDLDEEVISTELYNNILDGFICEKEVDEYEKKEMEK